MWLANTQGLDRVIQLPCHKLANIILVELFQLKPHPSTVAMECPLNRVYKVFKIAKTTVEPRGRTCPSFVIDCEIKRELTESSQKKLGRKYAKPLEVYPVQGFDRGRKKKRWVLKVAMPSGTSKESLFCRAIGFAFLSYRGQQ